MNIEQHYYKSSKINDSVLSKIARYMSDEVLSIASYKLGKKPSEMVVLDVGSGNGLYAEELSKKVKKVVGVEPYKQAFATAYKKRKKNLKFYNCKIEDFETHDTFDLALSLTTLEHMPDAELSFRRIFALLKKRGIIYLTAPNKLWPFEEHYKLPFLSYLPLPIANIYVQITGRGRSYEDSSYSKTYFGVRNLLNNFPCTYEFTLPDPSSAYLGMGTTNAVYHAIKNTGISLIRRFPLLWMFSKGFIVVIQKN